MAYWKGGVSGEVTGVGYEPAHAAHFTQKPIPHGVLGHYRMSVRFALVNSQAANSRLFEVRNPSSTVLVIPTRLEVRWLQTAAHTAAILDSLDLFKLTAFTAVDTANTVSPTASRRRTSNMAASPTAIVRHVTVAGAAAGMTTTFAGTKDGNAGGTVEQWLLLGQPTAGTVMPITKELLDDVNGTHPWVFELNEGFEIENRVALGIAAGSDVAIDFSWAEALYY